MGGFDAGQDEYHYEDHYPMEDYDYDYTGMRDFHDFEHFNRENGSEHHGDPSLINDMLWDHYHLNDPTLGAAEEWENFRHFDTDDNGKVSEHEFLQRMEPDYNSTKFSEDEMMKDVVNRWRAEFTDNDLNHDGYLDWEEWKKMLFHDIPQEADWVDGRRQGSVAESLENILLLSFDEGDVNNDGELTEKELVNVLKEAHRRHEQLLTEEGGGQEHRLPTVKADDFEQLSKTVLADLDKDGSKSLNAYEWLEYGRDSMKAERT